jgi:hypothetical protein
VPTTLSIAELTRAHTNLTTNPDAVERTLTALNMLFDYRSRQHCVRSPSQELTIAAVGAFRYFGLDAPRDLSSSLEARHSLFRSSRLGEAGFLLNVSCTTSAFTRLAA